MRKALFVLALALGCVSAEARHIVRPHNAPSGGTNVFTPITGNAAYKLVFDDEFNGASLNTSKWYAPTNGADLTYPGGRGEFLSANVSVSGGNLNLKVTSGPTVDGYDFGTGGVTSKGGTISGQSVNNYWEARIKNMSGNGLVSGWWTDQQSAYTYPEVDFSEYWYSQSPNQTRTNYNDGSNWIPVSPTNTPNPGLGDLSSGYHVYGCLWTPLAIKFYIDGVQVSQVTGNTNRTQSMWYGLLEATVGGNGAYPSAGSPSKTMQVDYVHVYSAQAGAVAVTPDTNYGGPGDTASCPYTDTAATDGCTASLGGGIQHTDFFTSYALQSNQTYTTSSFTGNILGGVLTVSGLPANTSAAASWATHAAAIQIPSGLGVAPGLVVYDVTTSTIIGVVADYTGTTLTLHQNYEGWGAAAASSGASDTIAFRVITGNETIIGPGVPPGVRVSSFGTGTGGNGTYNLANASGLITADALRAVRRPPWNVAGVDYAVGIPPSVLFANGPLVGVYSASVGTGWGKIPSGCSIIGSPASMHCNGVSNPTFQGLDFSADGTHGCVGVLFDTASTGTATFQYVKNHASGNSDNCVVWGAMISTVNGSHIALAINASDLDGGSPTTTTSTFGAITNFTSGNTTMSYTAMNNFPARPMNGHDLASGSPLALFQIDHSYIEGICMSSAACPSAVHGEIEEITIDNQSTGNFVFTAMNYLYNTILQPSNGGSVGIGSPGSTAFIYNSSGSPVNQSGSLRTTMTTVNTNNNTIVINAHEPDSWPTMSAGVEWAWNFYTNTNVLTNYIDETGITNRTVFSCPTAGTVGGIVTGPSFTNAPTLSGNVLMNLGNVPVNSIAKTAPC